MSMPVMKGVTVSIAAVPNFDQLSTKKAEEILYDKLVPECEKKGVLLSFHGNHSAPSGGVSVEKYKEGKLEHKLFNVERIQKAFSVLEEMIENRSKFSYGSYSLKHRVENYKNYKDRYIANGDVIAAMMLKGYHARFGKRNEPIQFNCDFKVVVKKEIELEALKV